MKNKLQFAHIEYSIQTKSIDIFNVGCDAAPRCKDCCNSELWNWENKGLNIIQVVSKVVSLVTKFDKLVDRIILVGGDPVDAYIRYPSEYLSFISQIRTLRKPIYLFTRHELSEIDPILLAQVDYVKTGAYIPELSCKDNIQCGIKLATSNQQIYKVSDILNLKTMQLMTVE